MVKKMVKNNEYELLKYLSQFLTVKQISNLRHISKTAVYKGIYRLLEKGLIRKIGNAYELTDIGFNRLNSFIGLSNTIRLHSLAFKIKILNKPINWDLKRSKIVDLRNLSKEVNLMNNDYQIHSFKNLKVKTTTDSVIFYIPSIYGKDTDICFKEALDMLFNSIPKIESMFKIVLIKDRKANIEIISQHYARLQDSLAKLYKLEDNKLYIRNERDELWLIADFSFNVNELETIHPITAKEDMDLVKKHINDWKIKNPPTNSELFEYLNKELEIMHGIQQNQLIFDKNMKSHLEVLNKIGDAIDELTSVIKKQNMKSDHTINKSLFDF